jgi:hypothetical protein
VAIEQFRSDNREPNTNMTAQPKIVQDAVASADQISRALSQSGYKADFSLESLKRSIDFSTSMLPAEKQNQAGCFLNNWVHVCLHSGRTLGRSFAVTTEANGRGMTTILKARSILPFACATGQSYGPSSAS